MFMFDTKFKGDDLFILDTFIKVYHVCKLLYLSIKEILAMC